jgi:hypothetical protein
MTAKTIAVATALLLFLAGLGTGLLAQDEEDLVAEVRQVVERVGGWPVWQHAELNRALRRSFDKRMLTPERKYVAEYSGVANVARILPRGRWERDTMVRGGGAYFSFSSGSNDYDKGPDIDFSQGEFSSGFYGGCFGHVVKLDGADLRTVRAENLPSWMRKSAQWLYEHRRGKTRARAEEGAVYAVRSVREDEADTLAVFRVLEMDDDGATFAWRVLERYPVWSRR